MAKRNIRSLRLEELKNNGFLEIPSIRFEDFKEDLEDDDLLDEEEYLSNANTEEISFVELAIINGYLHDVYRGKHEGIVVSSYGTTDNIGRLSFGGIFDNRSSFWYNTKFAEDENEYIFQTIMYIDSRGELNSQLHISSKKGISNDDFQDLFKTIKNLSFNNSEYKGKCIKVKMREGSFRGIEIINMEESKNELILNETQHRFVDQFVRIVGRGGYMRYLLNGEPGTGKAQPLDAKILTPNGWTTMGEINIGDEVLTPEGKTTKVIGVFPQGEKDIYEITTIDGKKTQACGEHLWKVFGIQKGKKRKKSWSILNTDLIKDKLDNTKIKLKLPLISSNVSKNLNDDKELFIDPYLMGFLLGDGSFNKFSLKFSTSDLEILDKISKLIGDEYNIISDTKEYDYLITRIEGKGFKGDENGNMLVREIDKLGLSDKKSHNKFIPEIYKNASLHQKISLIQGMMDSDGTVDKSSNLSYNTTSKQLALDFQELIWSIGGICKIKEKKSKYTYKGIKKDGKLSYNLSIRYHSPKELIWLDRKKDKISNDYQYSKFLKNNIKSIKFVGLKEAKCIMIDDFEHLYITDDYIVTHNTESIRDIARRLLPEVTFVIPEFRTTDDLTSIMEACEIFENGVIIMDDIDLFLGNREHGHYTSLLGQFLSFFDGVKKRKISLLASTNDKGLVDKAAERPGRFNFTLDYSFLNDEQIVKVCNIHLDEKWRIQEVYDTLTGTVGGKKAKVTGAFIANLAENLREMSVGDEEWTIADTVKLIEESYKGFYSSQVEKEKSSLGFTK